MTSRIFTGWEHAANKVRKGSPVLMAILALLLASVSLFAQANQSAIQGAVYDQSHAVIAGATVTVTDVARGAQRVLTTDSAGQYGANDLLPGKYTVRAESKGFQILEQSNVTLEVGQTIRVDLTLMPGEQTQTITVSSEAPAVDTTDAQFGGTVNNDLVNALPLNGRNFQRLVQLHPGVVTLAGNGTGTGQVTNGRRTGDDLYRVEGITTVAQSANLTGVLNGSYRSGDSSSLLPIDAIQEFNTEQNPKAQEGWKEGSTISIAVKSGTNAIHGSAYAFGRDTLATDAANAFTHTITPATLEQFGGSAGGRIIKDKLFWFASYEGLRDSLGDTTVNTIPVDVSLANIAGNGPAGNPGTSMVDACLSLKGAVNPLSARLAGITNTTTCTIAPSSASFENLFPFNTTTSTNFNPPLTTNGPLNNGVFKADYIPGPHHHINGTYFTSKAVQFVNQTAGELLPQWELNLADAVQMYTGSWTWVPNSAWVNDVRVGAAYFNNSTLLGDRNMLPQNPYPGGYSFPTGVTNPAYGGLPEITFSAFTGILGSGTRGHSQRGPEGNIDLVDNVSYLHGKHAFKFGFEYVDILFDGVPSDQAEGMIKFKTLANFLQGTTNGGTILVGNPATNVRSHWYAGYFQDDWRLTPKVTLNLGLRYEYYGAPTERNNYLGNFNPNVNPATTSAVEQVGPGEPVASLYNPDKNDFSPRVGVAWDVTGNGKTVVRSAVSLMTDYQNLQNTVGVNPFGASIPSIGLNLAGTDANLHSPDMPSFSAAQLNTGWNTTGPVFPISGSQSVCTNASQCSVAAVDPHLPQPRAVEWTLDVERAITNNLTLDVAYVGNHGFDEEMVVDLNQPAIGAGWTSSAVSTCITTNVCAANAAAEGGQYDTPGFAGGTFPYLSYINEVQDTAVSNYDALQVILNERVTHGLSFLAGYTYSHSLDDAVNLPSTPSNLLLNYASGNSDIRNRFTISPSYSIPGIKVPGQMLEGWSVSGLIALQSGQPWYPTDSTSDDLLGNGEFNNPNAASSGTPIQTWNFEGPKSAFSAGPSPFPCYGPLSGCTTVGAGGFTNPNAATAPIAAECLSAAQAPYAPGSTNAQLAVAALNNFGCYVAKGGTATPGGGILTPPAFGTIGDASRNIFRGPSYYNVDLSIAKTWKFKERYSAQFRAEFFNLFNRADFIGVPGQLNPDKGLSGQFGCSCSTPDSSALNPNPVLGSGGPRHIQFGLKLLF